MITAIVLDMDGLLIDTEPVWRTAEKEVFAKLGIELTQADLLDTTGVRIDELAAAFLPHRPPSADPPGADPSRPSPHGADPPGADPSRSSPAGPSPAGPSPAEVAARITDLVVDYVGRAGEPMPGVPEAIALFERSGLRLAIASSSPERLIDAVCARLKLDIDIRCSALDEPRGKPAPDVYLAAARRLRLTPARCLAVEDSPAGVVAAKAAGMTCVAVPDPLLTGDPRYRRADLVLPSLTELTEPLLRTLCWLASGAP
jgi:beta-phosphoglucomutase-like phosphatase (HAD superfamily)